MAASALDCGFIQQKDINCVKIEKMEREKVIDAVKELPKEFDLEELIERLIFVEKVEQGLKQLEEGKTVDHSQVKEMVKKW